MNPSASRFQDAVPLAGRILLAIIFIVSGLGKVAAAGPTIGYIQSAGLPFPPLAYIVAVVVEVLGGILLLIGYRARIVAWVLAIFTLVAGFAFHLALDDQNQFVHLLKNIAIAGGMLQVAAFGAGRFSLDERRSLRAADGHAAAAAA